MIMLVLAICTLIGTSVQAQTEPFGTAVLRAVTVTIISRNYATRQGGICHGAVYTVINSVAYVTTAKHCVETLSSAPLSP
ncbi:MAG TPA: hypothetical protein VFL28_08520, partial [bacterium]|nr:hypothetical protein [bacterium]